MSIRISNLGVPIDEPESELPIHLARTLGILPSEMQGWRLLRKSLDVRDKRLLRFVYRR